jgi:hypothetical protein
MVGRGEYEVRALVVEVFRQEFLRRVINWWDRGWDDDGFDGILHWIEAGIADIILDQFETCGGRLRGLHLPRSEGIVKDPGLWYGDAWLESAHVRSHVGVYLGPSWARRRPENCHRVDGEKKFR